MTVRLVASLAAITGGVAILAHTDPGPSWTAVAGWALLLAAFINLTTMRSVDR